MRARMHAADVQSMQVPHEVLAGPRHATAVLRLPQRGAASHVSSILRDGSAPGGMTVLATSENISARMLRYATCAAQRGKI